MVSFVLAHGACEKDGKKLEDFHGARQVVPRCYIFSRPIARVSAYLCMTYLIHQRSVYFGVMSSRHLCTWRREALPIPKRDPFALRCGSDLRACDSGVQRG
jgi:hypothetical protein